MTNSKSAVRPPNATNENKFYESPWFIGAVIAFACLLIFYMMNDSDDIGSENIKSTTVVNYWLEGELPTEEERALTFEEWNKKATPKHRDNVKKAFAAAKVTLGTGGDMSAVISNHTLYTGREPGPNLDDNVTHAMLYLAILSEGEYEVPDKSTVESALQEYEDDKVEQMMEIDDIQDELSSFRGASFEGNSGVIKLNSGEFVRFNRNDEAVLVSNPDQATRVGVFNNRLVRDTDDNGNDDSGVCFPFNKSLDQNRKIENTPHLGTKLFHLNNHACLDSKTFSHDVNMNGDIIEDIGGMCFGYGLAGSGKFELGRMSCKARTNRPEAKLVDLDTIGSSSANNGMGEEDVPSD
jgi:hypothetical protein